MPLATSASAPYQPDSVAMAPQPGVGFDGHVSSQSYLFPVSRLVVVGKFGESPMSLPNGP